ncbi:hypothetical protein SORBI_3008G108950 [Sorghum bicolor]|uniref:Uncharacterized protein n=1 Tax=Sorghum bicolor TaxID=4558 RepID=A0A1Z5R760_SORBI|nr:hypothetical protein SORBI_3008G108950 [Sorghum bicolor]
MPVPRTHPAPRERPPIRLRKPSLATIRRIARAIPRRSLQFKIVQELGFSFIFHLPSRLFIDKKLLAWLLLSLDTDSSVFTIDPLAPIPFSLSQVRSILGLPDGTDISSIETPRAIDDIRSEVAKILWYDSVPEEVSIARAQRVLDALSAKSSLSDVEMVAFRAAMIIAVVGNFFSARVGSTQVDPDVLRAIVVPNHDTRIDWGLYAFDVVKDCADSVKRELFSVRRPSAIELYGCSSLVTITYLMNTASPQPDRWAAMFPQIRHFTHPVLSRLDELDKVRRLSVDFMEIHARWPSGRTASPSVLEVGHPLSVFPTPYRSFVVTTFDGTPELAVPLLPTPLSTPEPRKLDTLLQAAGFVQSSDLDDKENLKHSPSVSVKRKRYDDSTSSPAILDKSPDRINLPTICTDNPTPSFTSKHANPPLIHSTSPGPLFDHTPRSAPRGFDLNRRPHEICIETNEVEVIVIEDSDSPQTPRPPHRIVVQARILNHDRDMWMYKMVTTTRLHKFTLFRDWVIFPPFIKATLTGSELIDQFKTNKPVSAKVMAAAMALFMEIDAQISINATTTTRRLFLPPGWATDCISGNSDEELTAAWAAFFAPPYLFANILDYNLVIAPLLFGDQWVCLGFDMDRKHVTIFHPGKPLAVQRTFVGQWYPHVHKMLLGLNLAHGPNFPSRVTPVDQWKIEFHCWDGRLTAKWFHGYAVAVFALLFDGFRAGTQILAPDYPYSEKWTLCRLLLDRPMNPLRAEEWFALSY